MAGGTGGGVTVKVTGIETGCAPGALSLIVPVWVPTETELLAGLIVTLPVPDPAAGLSVNHAASVVAFQFNVPPPLLLTIRVCEGGSELPR